MKDTKKNNRKVLVRLYQPASHPPVLNLAIASTRSQPLTAQFQASILSKHINRKRHHSVHSEMGMNLYTMSYDESSAFDLFSLKIIFSLHGVARLEFPMFYSLWCIEREHNILCFYNIYILDTVFGE